MFRYHGEEQQRLGGAGVDKGVTVTLGAVVALAGDETLLAVVIQASGLAAEDVDDLAVGLVAVVADGTPRFQPSAHNLVLSVVVGAEHRVALPALELRVGNFLNLVEIYYHVGKSFSFLLLASLARSC